MAIKSTLNTEVSYEGCVLEVWKGDYRAMSDVYTFATYATVWSFEKNEPVDILVNANFELDLSGRYAEVDATDVVKELFWAHCEALSRKQEEDRRLRAANEAVKAAKAPNKGRIVQVVRGRKVPLGTIGYVFWTGTDSYGTAKLGIATSNRKAVMPGKKYASFVDVVWCAASNCEALLDQTGAQDYQ